MRGLVTKPEIRKFGEQALKASKARSFISHARLSKAMNVAKNSSVRRFAGANHKPKIIERTGNVKQALSGEIIQARPASSSAAVAIQAPPSMITSVSHQRLERMLDEALLKADAHKQALTGRLSSKHGLGHWLKRLPTWVVVSLTILIVGGGVGLFAWQHVPQASIRLAAMRASIKASVPSYVPAGFKFAGPIKYDNGAVSMTYKAGADQQALTITQEASNWDSTSLAANVVPRDSQVQTSLVKGTTVYIYDSNNTATWVNNGIRYTIKDTGKLSSDQLLKIADSLK